MLRVDTHARPRASKATISLARRQYNMQIHLRFHCDSRRVSSGYGACQHYILKTQKLVFEEYYTYLQDSVL